MVYNQLTLKNWILFFLFFTTSLSAQESEKKITLLYENDVHQLTQEHFALLDSIKNVKYKELVDVHVKGYTNNIGDKAYNLKLSRKRAENVKSFLKEFTIVSSKGYGELESEASSNRRVDIFMHLKTDHIPMDGETIEVPVSEIKKKSPSIALLNPKKGDKMILEGIRFYTDRDVIMDESKEALEGLLVFLKTNPNIRFKLLGHICCGDWNNPVLDARNTRTGKRNLSEARAQAVRNYLVKNGIDKRRIRHLGMAYKYPTEKGDMFDRRVEIEIISVE